MVVILTMGRWVNSAKMGVDDVCMYSGYLMLGDENIGWEMSWTLNVINVEIDWHIDSFLGHIVCHTLNIYATKNPAYMGPRHTFYLTNCFWSYVQVDAHHWLLALWSSWGKSVLTVLMLTCQRNRDRLRGLLCVRSCLSHFYIHRQ